MKTIQHALLFAVTLSALACSEVFAQNTTAEKRLSQAATVRVASFRFEGNTVFPDAQLAAQLARFTNRDVSADELEEARRIVTQFYIERGYVNSGAVLRDQNVANGIVTFSIVEGRLTGVQISGARHFRANFLRRQFVPDSGPLNVIALRDRLQLLRQNPNIARINADVRPGILPGEASLAVDVSETKRGNFALAFDNHRPASVGAERVRLLYSNSNVSGFDDSFEARLGLARNGLRLSNPARLRDAGANYRSPAFGNGTRLLLAASQGDTNIIEEPFTTLGISSRSENFSLGVQQPLRRTLSDDFTVSLLVEHRKNSSFLFDVPFSFSPGDINGESETTALRLGFEGLRRGAQSVVAGRAQLGFGNNFPGSTRNVVAPGGKFLTFLGQLQNVRVLDEKGRSLVLRLDGQWTNDPLLTVEKFSIGGAGSVRGYRENQWVRDKGFAASAELRVPVLRDKQGRDRLTVAPFIDFGGGKNIGVATVGTSTISSAGVGLLYTSPRLNAQLYFGHPFNNLNQNSSDLQDKGIHFALSLGL